MFVKSVAKAPKIRQLLFRWACKLRSTLCNTPGKPTLIEKATPLKKRGPTTTWWFAAMQVGWRGAFLKCLQALLVSPNATHAQAYSQTSEKSYGW